MKQNLKRLILLDVHAILHRAYHALPDFQTSSGRPTGALYGLSAMLIKIVEDLKPDYLVACYDLPETTFRKEAYEDYKAGRAKTKDDLIDQIISSKEVFKAFGVPAYEKAGFEADDILGTIPEILKDEKDIEIIIASGDMDTLQLVDEDRVRVYTLKKGLNDTIIYNEKAVFERFKFPPKYISDYKGLRGDPSDNIIGIKGIGEKTAQILISQFGPIEEIYKKLKEDEGLFEKVGLTPRIINLLKEGEDDAIFSKELATIRKDVPIDFKLPEKTWRDGLDIREVENLFSELEFRALGRRLKKVVGIEDSQKEDFDEDVFKKDQIALWVLNSSITDPTFDDILNFSKTENLKDALNALEMRIKEEGLDFVYTQIELPLIEVCASMTEKGVLIDIEYFKNLSKEYSKELGKLEKEIYKLAGGEFNIKSPKQLSEILFEKMGVSPKGLRKTPGGVISTKESELKKIESEHEIISKILQFRELAKLLSTYIDNLPKMVGVDGRLHAKFVQTGTTTGRMSSQDPNLQNIPIKSELGRRIREGFISQKGFTFLSLDYSQIELRVAAFLSKDEKLIEIFKSGGDVHNRVASYVFGVPESEVDKEMRRRAKVINFGILYGMGVTALQKNLSEGGREISRKEAQEFYDKYFETFSGLALYLEQTKASALRDGYVETHFGRRRYFEGINSKIPFIKAMAQRMAINAPIQGTNADITKIAMNKCFEYIKGRGLESGVYLIIQIHDEIVFEVRDDLVEEITKEFKKIMEGVIKKEEMAGIPLVVDFATGKNWGEL